MKQKVFKDNVKGKTVRCIFIFRGYDKREFAYDFREFVKNHREKVRTADNLDYALYHLKHFPDIPFEYFERYGPELFAKAIFYTLKQYPEFIISDELNVQFFLKRVPGWGYAFETVDKAINEENACFALGTWFMLNEAVAPFFYLRRYRFQSIVRIMINEFMHFRELLDKSWSWDIGKNYEKKIRKIVGRRSAYGINFLYNSLFNLRENGFAYFVQRWSSPEIEIVPEAEREFYKNLEALALIRYKKDAMEYYALKIGWKNISPSGESAIGRNMCLIIALAVAKEQNEEYTIKSGGQTFFGNNVPLDRLLSGRDSILISGLSKKVFTEAFERIRNTNHYFFVGLYERACDTLGISGGNRVITRRRFYKLVKTAKKIGLSETKRLVKKNGFVFIESDIRLPET